MEIEEFNKKTNELITESLPDSDVAIENDATFDEDGLDADSLAIVESMYSINDVFGVEIEEEMAEDIETVGHLKLYILSQSSGYDVADAEEIGLDTTKLADMGL